MRSLNLYPEQIHRGSLILVNRQFSLLGKPGQHELENPHPHFPHILLSRQTSNMLKALFHKLNSLTEIIPVSGYRTPGEQKSLYSQSLKDRGKEFTSQFVALPNHSEHQTGLAVDLGKNQAVIDQICPDFPSTGICRQFRQEASLYGFIQRYPQGREDITNIACEPWHFRYIGYPHSLFIDRESSTLEEYTSFLRSYPYGKSGYRESVAGQHFETFYVSLKDNPLTTIELPDNLPYQLSGDNRRGAFITIWNRM